MSLVVLPGLVQGTDEWLQQRCGMVTASAVDRLLTATGRVADTDGHAHNNLVVTLTQGDPS